MNPKFEGLEIGDVHIHANGKGFTVGWDSPKIGFGDLTIWLGEDGKIHADTECMSKEFVSLLLSKLVDFIVVEE